MMDMSLLKDPVFVLIGISNLFGMAGLYIPFFYLVPFAEQHVRGLLIKIWYLHKKIPKKYGLRKKKQKD